MKNATRESKFQVLTSIKDSYRWADCFMGHEVTSKPIKTFYHGRECTVCKDCINKITFPAEATDKPTAKQVSYLVEIITTTDNCKAYLFVNGYSHPSANKWQSKYNRFSAPRKVIDELTKTTAYGNAVVNVTVFDKDGNELKSFRNIKDASIVKDFTDSIK